MARPAPRRTATSTAGGREPPGSSRWSTSPRVHARPAWPPGPGAPGGASPRSNGARARSSWPTGSAGPTARPRGDRGPRDRAVGLGRIYAFRGYVGLQQVDRVAARAAPAARRSFYKPDDSGAQEVARGAASITIPHVVVRRGRAAAAAAKRSRTVGGQAPGGGEGGSARPASRIRSASFSACLSGGTRPAGRPRSCPGPLRCGP